MGSSSSSCGLSSTSQKKVLLVHCCEKLKHPETYFYKPHQSQLCLELRSVILNAVSSLKPLNPYPISGSRNTIFLCAFETIISLLCWHNFMFRWFQLFPDNGMFLCFAQWGCSPNLLPYSDLICDYEIFPIRCWVSDHERKPLCFVSCVPWFYRIISDVIDS